MKSSRVRGDKDEITEAKAGLVEPEERGCLADRGRGGSRAGGEIRWVPLVEKKVVWPGRGPSGALRRAPRDPRPRFASPRERAALATAGTGPLQVLALGPTCLCELVGGSDYRSVVTTTTRNLDLREARRAKADEFYTSMNVIELELQHYARHFEDKIVYCNCDDPQSSNFFRYFALNFERLGLKKLITTCYRDSDTSQLARSYPTRAVRLEYTGGAKGNRVPDPREIGLADLSGDGDFRSDEALALLRQADVIVTNPPFSLFREFVSQLFEFQKKFLILGNMNALTYKEIFPLFQSDRMWYGPSIRSGDREFRVPDDYPLFAAGSRLDADGNKYVRVKGVRWFTNLEYEGRHDELDLQMTYRAHLYPKYANFDAIHVGRTKHIPVDYGGPMGVPISYLDKHSPAQFEILGSSKTLAGPMTDVAKRGTYQQGGPRFYLPNGDGTYRRMYDRIVIRNKQL